jgi:hypothetical protein
MTAEEFVVPTKQIVSPSDLHAFIHSDTYPLIDSFVEDLSTSVVDTEISPAIKTSQVRSLLNTRINFEEC